VTIGRHGVIDVGTNSVKLLVAEFAPGSFRPVLEESEQTRLGRGFYETHVLLPDAIAETAKAVAKFTQAAQKVHAESIRVIGTSAARDAVNRPALIDAIETASGLKVEIISGQEEAELVFRGVATDPKLQGRRLLIVDVGGGSTELILGEGRHHQFCQSFGLGTVRLLEKLRPGDPPSPQDLHNCRARLKDFVAEQIAPVLEGALLGGASVRDGGARARPPKSDGGRFPASRTPPTPATLLVGTGGTTTILARMEKQMTGFDRDAIEGTIITRERIAYWMEKLWSLSLAQRREIPGVPPKRADIIPMGAAIYEAVMERFGFVHLFVSTRGLRFGALMQDNE